MKIHKSITNRIKTIFASKQGTSPNHNDDGDMEGKPVIDTSNDENTTDEKGANLTPSLEELASEMSDVAESMAGEEPDEEESEEPLDELHQRLSTKESTDVSEQDEQTPTAIEGPTGPDEQQGNLIPSLEQLIDEIPDDDKKSKKPLVNVRTLRSTKESTNLSERDKQSEKSTSSPKRMEASRESKIKKESPPRRKESAPKREESKRQPRNQKETSRKSEAKEETFRSEDLQTSGGDNGDLELEIKEAKVRLSKLERWYRGKNSPVRQKFLSKEIRKQEAKINSLMSSGSK